MAIKFFKAFQDKFFIGELNRFSGSGGEILVKGSKNLAAPATRIDVGDRLIGMGITHTVESLGRSPGPDSFQALNGPVAPQKMAARAFVVMGKTRTDTGFRLELAPLSPQDYSALLRDVSAGTVTIPAKSIPKGTMIVSFLDKKPKYTLQTVAGSPGRNWAPLANGERYWSVGIGNKDDFWAANLPADDIGLLAQIPASTRVGEIRFGLSLLAGAKGKLKFLPVPFQNASGRTTAHQFCLSGAVVGTQGLNTPFPIGLRTEILFHPVLG